MGEQGLSPKYVLHMDAHVLLSRSMQLNCYAAAVIFMLTLGGSMTLNTESESRALLEWACHAQPSPRSCNRSWTPSDGVTIDQFQVVSVV